MASPVESVRAEVDRIRDAYDQIEMLLVELHGFSADDWRQALGLVESATRYGYAVKKAMLDEAIRASESIHREKL